MKCEKQEQLKEHLPQNFFLCFKELEQKVSENFFTAWSFANEDGCMSGFWLDEYLNTPTKASDSDTSESPCLHPQFDLSSLTKPFFINLYLRFQWEKNSEFAEKITTPLSQLYKNAPTSGRAEKDIFSSFFKKKENEKFSLDSFLSHTSGAKNWFWMGSSLYGKDSIEENLRRSSLASIGARFGETIYSDINYFILARILEDISNENFNWNNVTDFLNTRLQTNFLHASLEPQKTRWSVPFCPYVISYSPDSIVLSDVNMAQGNQNVKMVVHDPNANFLATQDKKKNIVSGHAGLFGNIIDIARATRALSENQCVVLKSLGKNQKISEGFVFGLDRPSFPHSPSGVRHWQEHKNSVYGHLGYTGTSFWFFNDPEEIKPLQFHILLTNRTAQRKDLRHKGSASENRIFIYSDFKSNTQSFFLKSENCFFKISLSEAQAKIKKYYESSVKKIDSSVLRNVPNMSEIRSFIANHLWDI